MTADEFMRWVMRRPGGRKYELSNGRVVAKSPETWGHGRIKARIARLLGNAIESTKLGCDVVSDGVAVRVDGITIFEPDILVRCGPSPPFDTLEIDDPVIVVEVLSPSTAQRDKGVKLAGYLRLPSVQHCLLVSGDARRMVHHRRVSDTEFATRLVGTETIRLDPPGIVLAGVFD